MKTLITLIILGSVLSWAQSGAPAPSAQAGAAADSDEEPDVPVAKPANTTGASMESQTTTAWNMLQAALSDTRTQAQQARIDAIVALGTLGDFTTAEGWLRGAESDQDRYIRLAIVAAMASSKKAVFIPDLKHALNDNAAEVKFAAAVGLWKMNDRSGEDILDAVLARDQKATRGAVTAEKHEAGQDLHSPSKLATIGAEQGAYALLGPFGFGLSAIRGRKGQNTIHPRVLAVTLLAEDTSSASMKRFIDALDDPDPAVRAVAARALGDYHTKEVDDALSDEFYDAKPAVRFMAAAAYIRATHAQPEHKIIAQQRTTHIKP
jgi:HEAT repeat protein